MLKTAKTVLIITDFTKKISRGSRIAEPRKSKYPPWDNLKRRPKIKAKAKFIETPAMDTKKVPTLRSLNLKGFMGTGFAQPKSIGEPSKRSIAGKIIVPRGSM